MNILITFDDNYDDPARAMQYYELLHAKNNAELIYKFITGELNKKDN